MIYDCVRLLNTKDIFSQKKKKKNTKDTDCVCCLFFFLLNMLRYGKIFKIGH